MQMNSLAQARFSTGIHKICTKIKEKTKPGCYIFFMLNSGEHEISTAHKN